MYHKERGLALLFNNIEYTTESKRTKRFGSHFDLIAASQLYEQLGFIIRVFKDCTSKVQCLKYLSKHSAALLNTNLDIV